jgi:hypothetical protein
MTSTAAYGVKDLDGLIGACVIGQGQPTDKIPRSFNPLLQAANVSGGKAKFAGLQLSR